MAKPARSRTEQGGRRLAATLIVTWALSAVPAPAPAAEASGLDWLMNEPVTLFDLGMLRLRQELTDASRWLRETGTVDETPVSGVYYQWWNRLIIAYVTVRDARIDPEAETCRQLFAQITRRLMTGVPGGTRRAEIYLENLFLHAGLGNYGRPRRLSTDLASALQFEVTVLSPLPAFAGGPTVRCAGPLDAAPAALTVQETG